MGCLLLVVAVVCKVWCMLVGGVCCHGKISNCQAFVVVVGRKVLLCCPVRGGVGVLVGMELGVELVGAGVVAMEVHGPCPYPLGVGPCPSQARPQCAYMLSKEI